jgi:hypothetical protein
MNEKTKIVVTAAVSAWLPYAPAPFACGVQGYGDLRTNRPPATITTPVMTDLSNGGAPGARHVFGGQTSLTGAPLLLQRPTHLDSQPNRLTYRPWGQDSAVSVTYAGCGT